MAKQIIYPTNENEILTQKVNYTKTKDGITNWNFWTGNSSDRFGFYPSLVNPITKMEALLDYRKKMRVAYERRLTEQQKNVINPIDNQQQLKQWLEKEGVIKAASYFEFKDSSSNWVDLKAIAPYYYSEAVLFFENLFLPQLDALNTLFTFTGSWEDDLKRYAFEMEKTRIENSMLHLNLKNKHSDTAFLSHSIIRKVTAEINKAYYSTIENFNGNSRTKLNLENSTLTNFEGSNNFTLVNSKWCDTAFQRHTGGENNANIFLENVSLINCTVKSNNKIKFRGEDENNVLTLKNITILDFREISYTTDEETTLTADMVKNNKIILY
ncbi:hypothetical protein D7I46_01075 [Lactococcus allomyrinae]|uniref:Uncharacterized protein n=2 Tax=Lactococcus allomyrinae TaxID=2419773 RepID=A0A387BFP4_9LACT|nr:hypothetical protein D7I46_01075 [Lactococcus allomyrinae]